ncbi:MAG: hypothetical protein HZA52_14145 [Planctomycetes bacterium]|nr:hypothetical protein [Planctomycetota bacterium]
MTDPTRPSEFRLEIQEPCHKTWDELQGDDVRRFCAECRLHVHSSAALTREQARELVTRATSRVCMRVQYDAAGAPVYLDSVRRDLERRAPELRDSKHRDPIRGDAERATQRFPHRLLRWAASAAAGVLAACSGGAPTVDAPSDPSTDGRAHGGETTTELGKVRAPERIGDVALPAVEPPRELLGEVFTPAPQPVEPATQPTPPSTAPTPPPEELASPPAEPQPPLERPERGE